MIGFQDPTRGTYRRTICTHAVRMCHQSRAHRARFVVTALGARAPFLLVNSDPAVCIAVSVAGAASKTTASRILPVEGLPTSHAERQQAAETRADGDPHGADHRGSQAAPRGEAHVLSRHRRSGHPQAERPGCPGLTGGCRVSREARCCADRAASALILSPLVASQLYCFACCARDHPKQDVQFSRRTVATDWEPISAMRGLPASLAAASSCRCDVPPCWQSQRCATVSLSKGPSQRHLRCLPCNTGDPSVPLSPAQRRAEGAIRGLHCAVIAEGGIEWAASEGGECSTSRDQQLVCMLSAHRRGTPLGTYAALAIQWYTHCRS